MFLAICLLQCAVENEIINRQGRRKAINLAQRAPRNCRSWFDAVKNLKKKSPHPLHTLVIYAMSDAIFLLAVL